MERSPYPRCAGRRAALLVLLLGGVLVTDSRAASRASARPTVQSGAQTARVLALGQRLADSQASGASEQAAAELRAYWRSIDARVEQASGDERQAFLVAGVLLATHGERSGVTGAERLAVLERSRAVGSETASAEFQAWADYALARELVLAGHHERAEALLRASLAGPGFGSANELAMLHLLAEVLRAEARWEEAFELLDALRARLEELDARAAEAPVPGSEDRELWWARLFGSRCQLQQRLGRLDLAALELAQERAHADRSGDPSARAACLIDRCDLALLTEDYAFVERTLATVEEGEVLDASQRAQLALYRAVAESEAEREDPERPRRARELLEAVLGDAALPLAERLAAERTLTDELLRAGRLEAARECLASLRARLRSLEAGTEHVAERVGARVLEARLALASGADRAALAARRDELVDAWRLLLEQWSRSPLFPGGVGFLHHSERREALSVLVRMDLELDGERVGAERALEHLLEAEAMGTLARRFGLARATLADLRREFLRERHGVLLYLPSREGSHLFGFDARSVWHVPLEPWGGALAGDVRDLMARFQQHPAGLQQPERRAEHAAELERLARRVSERLLPGRARAALEGWERVTVLGTDHLSGFAPELLRTRSGWLGAERAVDAVPSLSVALALVRRARSAPSTSGLVLLAALDPGAVARARWPELVPGRLERDTIEHLSRPFGARALTVAEASLTLDRLRALDLSRASVVHFVAHGVQVRGRERRAALLLAGGAGEPQVLGCDEVEELSLSGVVLLSACGSARGPGRPGDDSLAHLGGAFLLAGARAVVLSSASVGLRTSMDLMAGVHERLAAGDSPAEALRAARRALGASDDPLAPFLGAQFAVMGLGQEASAP